ncbi:hypothetical protein AGMMS4957_02240 [Bacteroidia bacterium]|nr:hypothetical protein AGMMS4957_02240 [Bacteroidia bacterium]
MKQTILTILLLTPLWLAAQAHRTNVGISLSAELQKSVGRNWSVSLEEEVRLVNNETGFDRSATAIGVDYTFLNNQLKVGAYYAFIYLYNSNHYYEPRQRYYLNLAYKQPVSQFTFSWRGRVQGTHRDEARGDYKINPKYVMKNKLEVDYTIWGKPWKPYLSCDLSTELNDYLGNDLTRLRYQGGTGWRLNRTDYVELFLRYDHHLNWKDANVVSLGLGYKVKW